MIAASYAWRFGEYYNYGWFVPLAAIGLMIRRWRQVGVPLKPLSLKFCVIAGILLVPWLLALRILCYTDPGWRLPMALLGITAALLGHYALARLTTWKISISFTCITLLWMSALPWPVSVERSIVNQLTDAIVTASAEIFQLLGTPVEVMGDRLRLHELTVEVTDGCSGIRSFQSFIMATFFFSELQHLRIDRACILFVSACGIAFFVNLARTMGLAEIRFTHGVEAFDQAHDLMGLAAFGISGTLFYLISGKLAQSSQRKLVRVVKVSPTSA